MKNAEEKSLDERIKVIEERNKRVELDKKWEGSGTRRVLIVFLPIFPLDCLCGLLV